MTSDNPAGYADQYRDIDFRQQPERYVIGRGEQGVLIAEPYKSEILPHWRFKTPAVARQSATKLYAMFVDYGAAGDFVGMDMARKFLQMGFTRARRYANHASGRKYVVSSDSSEAGDANSRSIRPQDAGSETSDKAESARIFKTFYDKARSDATYLKLTAQHVARRRNSKAN